MEEDIQAMMLDYREWPRAHQLGTRPKGIRGSKLLKDLLRGPFWSLYPELIVVGSAIFLFYFAPVSAVISFALSTRVLAVFLLTPTSASIYLYDIYLAGILLFFALAFEVLKSNGLSIPMASKRGLAMGIRVTFKEYSSAIPVFYFFSESFVIRSRFEL